MGRGRDIVEAAKDYRLARPEATANMIEDVLRDLFLGDARERALADRVGRYGGYVGLPLSGVVGVLVGRLREWWSPPDRQAIHGRIKAAVQVALAADMAAHAALVTRRAVRRGLFFGILNLGVATAFAVMAEGVMFITVRLGRAT